jgi:hypothetical protein
MSDKSYWCDLLPNRLSTAINGGCARDSRLPSENGTLTMIGVAESRKENLIRVQPSATPQNHEKREGEK